MMSGDDLLIARLQRSNALLRLLLCAAARRGKALRRDEPERAGRLLQAAAAHPVYKATRVWFDLLELEDLMLDGPLPPDLDAVAQSGAMDDLAVSLERFERALAAHAGEALPAASTMSRAVRVAAEPAPPGGWPEVAAADYLFDLVVLGVLRHLSRLAETAEAMPGAR